VRAAFQRYDRDKSGKLDDSELKAALQHIGLNPSQKDANELLKSYDGDKNGLMDMNESGTLLQPYPYPHPYPLPLPLPLIRSLPLPLPLPLSPDPHQVRQSRRGHAQARARPGAVRDGQDAHRAR